MPLSELKLVADPEPCIQGLADHGDCILLAGSPDAGKSCLAAYVAACLTSGSPVFGLYECRAANVVWLAYEESRQQLKKRLHWIPDAESRLRVWTPEMDSETGEVPDPVQMFRSEEADPTDLAGGLLIVDPLLSAFRFRDPNNAGEVRTTLMPLRHLAQEGGFACLVLHHMRKGAGGSLADRILGSNQYAAVFPTKWLIEPSPAGDELRFEAQGKFQEPVRHVLTRTNPQEYSPLAKQFPTRSRRQKPGQILKNAAKLRTDAKRILRDGPMTTARLCEALGLSAPYGPKVRAVLEESDAFRVTRVHAKEYEIGLR